MALWQLPESWPQIAKFYLEAFRDVPVDLVDRALEHARLNCKWCPKPSELLDPIRQSLETRRRLRETLEAKAAPIAAPRGMTEAERAAERPAIDAALEEIRTILPAEKKIETYRSETPAAQARRDLLRQAAEQFTAGILDGTIPNPIEGMRS